MDCWLGTAIFQFNQNHSLYVLSKLPWKSRAPFTLHVGPGKLPENCRSAFCVNANTVGDLVTLPGSVPERALCEQKPDQCRKGCVVVMTHFIIRLFYRVFWRQINVQHDEKCVNWNEAAIRELLTIRAELKSFSLVKWWAAHYTRHMNVTLSLRDLYGLCVNARTDSGKSLPVWMNQNQTIQGQITGQHFPCIFWNGCVKEALV